MSGHHDHDRQGFVAPVDLVMLPPIERALRAAALTTHHRTLVGHYAALRRAAVVEALTTMTPGQVARALGISAAAVSKLSKPDRA